MLSQSQSDREQTHEGHACVERRKAEGIKQRAGRCHKGNATACSPEPPHSTHTHTHTHTPFLSLRALASYASGRE
eukprot:366097-Chlamydomonas_euryale.AAC.1